MELSSPNLPAIDVTKSDRRTNRLIVGFVGNFSRLDYNDEKLVLGNVIQAVDDISGLI